MGMPHRYAPRTAEPALERYWQDTGIYRFSPVPGQSVYAIDTPPATVSGHLHLGHVYSYSHADFMARFWRMNGRAVFYPMGYDDNGLPTERLVERRLGHRAEDVGRSSFIQACLEVSAVAEQEYQALWRRLGLSVDWRYTYRTIDDLSRRTSQFSFIDLYHRGHIYRRQAPTIWCPTCHTAIAQAELADLERESQLVSLAFGLENGATLPIATTRPELLPACVAVFVHPDDARFKDLLGCTVRLPLFEQDVPLLADPGADPHKGTGAVMCCTFGDTADVDWWRTHDLPLHEAIDREGRMTAIAGAFAGETVARARGLVVDALEAEGYLLGRQPILQSVRVHERCDTPVEYIVTGQWFIRVLDVRDALLKAGEQLTWHPDYMGARYREWVEGLRWDWCISRQRYFGVPFPLWYCTACGHVVVAGEDELPVDPIERGPAAPCACGSTSFEPERDVMDTWATSSLTPQIVGRWLTDPALYAQVFPMTLRPQAHEIIRTWTFYTIAKSYLHFGVLPWRDVMISGWALAPQGMGKISKSRGGGPMAPLETMEQYSADAVRYWAASAGAGRDTTISEERIGNGARLVTKLWNVARFSERFLAGYRPPANGPSLSPADRWIISRAQRLVERVTELFHAYDYAGAKSETEAFFWSELADNYLEMAKTRLYDAENASHEGARWTLYHVLLTVVKLFAPLLPFVTEEIYRGLFNPGEGAESVHVSAWPVVDAGLMSAEAEAAGAALVVVATAVRRYKSEHALSLGAPLEQLQVATDDPTLASALYEARADVASVTRAQTVEILEALDPTLDVVTTDGTVGVGMRRRRA